MQVGVDSDVFERAGLLGLAPGQERKARPVGPDHRHLLFEQVGRYKGQKAHPPTGPGRKLLSLCEHLLELLLAQQRDCQQRERSRLGHGSGKGGHVADTGHGPLHYGEPRAVCCGEGAVLVERPRARGDPHVRRGGLADRLQDAAHGAEPVRQGRGERGVLAHGPQLLLGAAPPQPPAHLCAPFRGASRVSSEGLRQAAHFVHHGEARPRVETEGLPELVPQAGRLAAVHPGERGLCRLRQRRFPGQREL